MILDDLVAATAKRLQTVKSNAPIDEVKKAAEAVKNIRVREDFPFKRALSKDGLSFICEVKKASPSKGIIAEDFPYLDIAKSYEAAGADAVSVLTEPDYFKGSTEYLREIAAEISLPCLRKDFIIDEYMIYEAGALGASAVLLICAILSDSQLKEYLELAHYLGMSALVETHSPEEAERAAACGAEIIGVNNRDLRTFEVDLHTTENVAAAIPREKILVSESGIHSADDIAFVRGAGADAVLIGEAFMRAENKAELMNRFRNNG
ncbi:MAG: indole-3-glycerol phosphate synthase TrpC [Ruminococcus sp.]|nr:indole-3-glycerol phosphate synthase TrpC [Ruminococcus sp.]